MSSFLLNDGVPIEDVEKHSCKLYNLAESISVFSKDMEESLDMVSVAFVESRFSYNVSPRKTLKSYKGACGIFQIVPKYAHPRGKNTKADCVKLNDPWQGTFHAKHTIDYFKSTYQKDWLCHYNSGNKCYESSKKYAKYVSKIKTRAKKKLKNFELSFVYNNIKVAKCSLLFRKQMQARN